MRQGLHLVREGGQGMNRLEITGRLVNYCSRQRCSETGCECYPMCDSVQKPFEEMTDKELEQCYKLAFGITLTDQMTGIIKEPDDLTVFTVIPREILHGDPEKLDQYILDSTHETINRALKGVIRWKN